MPKALIVKGHTLPFEGRVMDVYHRLGSGPGFGRCSCGVTSEEELPTTAARQRWHRNHKIDVLAAVVVGYKTLQFHTGGLFDGKPVGDTIHLVKSTAHGTPGPTLCGFDRFSPDSPGWSVGGGISGPDLVFKACKGCEDEADPELPIEGTFRKLFRIGDEP